MGEAGFGAALERLARDQSADVMDRARAVYELHRHGPAPTAQVLAGLAADTRPVVRAAALFAAGYQRGAVRTAAAGLEDVDARVRRRLPSRSSAWDNLPTAPAWRQ